MQRVGPKHQSAPFICMNFRSAVLPAGPLGLACPPLTIAPPGHPCCVLRIHSGTTPVGSTRGHQARHHRPALVCQCMAREGGGSVPAITHRQGRTGSASTGVGQVDQAGAGEGHSLPPRLPSIDVCTGRPCPAAPSPGSRSSRMFQQKALSL